MSRRRRRFTTDKVVLEVDVLKTPVEVTLLADALTYVRTSA
jgi:hypothetical protein